MDVFWKIGVREKVRSAKIFHHYVILCHLYSVIDTCNVSWENVQAVVVAIADAVDIASFNDKEYYIQIIF